MATSEAVAHALIGFWLYAETMTGHTSNEELNVPQENHSTDSESATKFPAIRGGVVQDSPGNPDVGTTDKGLLDEHGNLKKDDSNVLDAAEDK